MRADDEKQEINLLLPVWCTKQVMYFTACMSHFLLYLSSLQGGRSKYKVST